MAVSLVRRALTPALDKLNQEPSKLVLAAIFVRQHLAVNPGKSWLALRTVGLRTVQVCGFRACSGRGLWAGGGRLARILERRALSPPDPNFVASGRETVVEDVDGNSFIDLTAGLGCLTVGHSHPKVLEAIRAQSEEFAHTDFSVAAYEPYLKLGRGPCPCLRGRMEQVNV